MTSALALLLMPQWASVGSILQGGWRGVMVNKNVLGRTIGFAVIVFFILRKYVYRGRAKKIMLVGSIMAFVMLVGSRSVTSLFAVILAYLLLIVLSFQMRFAAYLRVAIFSVSVALLVPGMIMFVTYFEDILAVFGKNATLTGRIPLWSALLPYVMDRFWLGYGYGAFWASMGGPIVYLYRLFSWLPTHAHNGYLDVWIDIGIIGLFLTVLIFLKLIYYCVNEMMITGRKNYITVMIFFFVIYLNAINVTYNLMLEARLGGGIYWVVLSWMFMYVKSRKELGILHGGKL
ncbi:MAG: O-antigen ligase family protein [Bacteroidetes bacterium]|nr:MAG: O-antigen ligase family protein [Bacteroidota bacterium]